MQAVRRAERHSASHNQGGFTMVNAIVGYVRRHHVALLALFMAMNGTPLTIGVVTEV